MAVIKIRDNEPFEIAMKRFKKPLNSRYWKVLNLLVHISPKWV